MTTVRLNDIAYQFPDTWEQIPPALRAGVLRIVWEHQTRTTRGRLAILFYVSPIPAKVFKKLVAWQVNELCALLDWVWQKPIEGRPFENFEHSGTTYFTPGESFKNTTFGEFLNAYTYFFQLMYDTDSDRDEIASKLMATLCRPCSPDLNRAADRILSPSWSGDHREAFNEHVVEPRSVLLRDVNPGILAGIIQYFLHELKWLYSTYEIFETPQQPAIEADDEDQESEPEPYDWIATLMDMKDIKYILVEEKLYLTPQAVMNDNLNNIFDALLRLKERSASQPAPAPQPTYQQDYD
jgi:hypothetical protein